ncbi:MAG: serine/threonine protein kinase [Deltaproteobacteria bacterium]|nr:serine/threonine protein kinase [Deltaproteobacteria bacterium]
MATTTTPTGTAPGADVPAPSDLVFGRYQIIRRLAVGGMGEVFLARQSGVAGFDRLVILKSLLPDLASQEDFVNQFLDEARVAATLNHPNIVSIYEVGLWNGTYFIAMEYIRGDNLSRLARASERAKRRMTVDVAAFIIHDAAQALDHAHKACDLHGAPLHIVHRDVSPQNIMVRTDGVTKVVDFGIAKAANRSSRTATGLLKGKVQYMAPEQVMGGTVDGRTDQFALGVVLWELVAGRKLFSGGNDIEVLRAVLHAPMPTLLEVEPSCPHELSRIVARMIARDAGVRYATLAEAAAELKAFLDVRGMKNAQQATAAFVADTLGDEISAKTVDLTPSSANNFVITLSSSEKPPTAPTVQTSRGGVAKVGVAAGAAVAVLLALGAAALLFLPEERPPERVQERAAPKIAVDAQPAGAAVTVDGKGVGTAPVTVEVTADVEHVVEISAPGHEPRIEKVRLAAGDMRGVMANLQKQKTKLALTTDPPGATVKLDDAEVGVAPLELEVEADRAHAVSASLDRGKDRFRYTGEVTGKPGERLALALRLDRLRGAEPCPPGSSRMGGRCLAASAPPAAPVEAGKGFLTVKTTPWAKISIDGQPWGSTPVAKVPLGAGPHTVRLVNEEAGKDVTRKVIIRNGETLKQDWQL